MYFEQGSIDKYRQMISDLKSRFDVIQKEVNKEVVKLEEKKAEIENCNISVNNLQNKYDEIDKKIKEKNQEHTLLLQSIDSEQKELSKVLSRLKESRGQNEDIISLIGGNKEELLLNENKKSKLLSDINSLMSKRDEINIFIDNLKSEISSLKSEKSELNKQMKEISVLIEDYKKNNIEYHIKVEKLNDRERMLVRAMNEINNCYKELNIDKTINIWQEQQ